MRKKRRILSVLLTMLILGHFAVASMASPLEDSTSDLYPEKASALSTTGATDPTEPEATDPTEPEATDPTEPEATDPTEPEATDPTEPEATDPTEPEATDPTEPEATDPTEPEATDPTEPEATDPTEPEATDPTEPEATEPTDPEPTEPADDSYKYDAMSEGIVTSYYHIDRERNYIIGVAPGTSAQRLKDTCLPKSLTVSQEKLATGTVLYADESIPALEVIVTGDLNGDGDVTITDMLMIKSSVLGEKLSPNAAVAGDMNYDGGITITDFLRIKSVLLGLGRVSAGRPDGAVSADPMLLITPDVTATWNCKAHGDVTYISGDEAMVSVDAAGNITSFSVEGSTYVYALDKKGQLIDRVMVTVLNEALSVSVDASSYKLFTGSTQALTVSFNHPFPSPVTWISSDDSVVSVSADGTMTANKAGVATVTAIIENGNKADVTVTVTPLISRLTFDKSLYKIKPGAERKLGLLAQPADGGEEFIWESSNPKVATVSADGTVTGISRGTVTIKVTGKYSGLSATCSVKICNVKQVAITFDDGPSPYTERLLDFLKKNDIKVTFFLVANRISYYKEEVIREVAEGHEIGYHSYAHDIQTGLSSEKIKSDFLKSNQILKELTGAEFTVWRTPGGNYNDRVLKCVELPHILWSLDTFDWQSLNANAVYRQITSQSVDGSIILIHDLHRTSVEGAIKALTEMVAGDYEFVTVTELLSRDGTPPEPCINYRKG